MSESLKAFFSQHPFWAVVIVVFMVLPMIGAVLHIVLKALGRRGVDNSPPSQPYSPPDEENEKSGTD